MDKFVVECPKCGNEFVPADAYNQKVKAEVEKELKRSREKMQEREEKLIEKEKQLLTQQEEINSKVELEVKQKLSGLQQVATKQAAEKVAVELKDLHQQVKEKEKALQESHDVELTLRKQVRDVEEKEKRLELEIERQTQVRVEELKNSTMKHMEEEYRLKILEKEKKIKDIETQLEAAKRTANQGSQQTQGEAIEEDFENQLVAKFPTDTFEPVPKGTEGADLIQTVRGPTGQQVGLMLWEFKNTKAYSPDWITKLTKDQRDLGADIAILVTKTLPKDAPPISFIDGVFVVSYAIAIPFAATLRKSLGELSYARAVVQGQDEKTRLIYQYLTGPAFKQKILCIVESFETIKDQLESEKKAFKKMWASREKMLEQVIDSATSMYGDIEGIAGCVLPEVPSLILIGTQKLLAEKTEETVGVGR